MHRVSDRRNCIALLLFAVLLGCGPSSIVVAASPGGVQPDSGASGSSSGAGGQSPGAGGMSGGLGGSPSNSSCSPIRQQASIARRSIDLIVVVSNDATMRSQMVGIEASLNNALRTSLVTSGEDYQVILISKHGKSSGPGVPSICVGAPLSANTTCGSAQVSAMPVGGERFLHVDSPVGSTESYRKILETYPQWRSRLRVGSLKALVVFSAGNDAMASDEFDRTLLGLDPAQFGTVESRSYVLHSVLSIRPAMALFHLPEDMLVAEVCTPQGDTATGRSSGISYQELARLTGGFRGSFCKSASYDSVFLNITRYLATRARVSCVFPLPSGPDVLTNKVIVNYTSGSGATRVFESVGDQSRCALNRFYLEGGQVRFCAQTCQAVQNDPAASVEVLFTCEPQIN
jgi:hypothetical protein